MHGQEHLFLACNQAQMEGWCVNTSRDHTLNTPSAPDSQVSPQPVIAVIMTGEGILKSMGTIIFGKFRSVHRDPVTLENLGRDSYML